MIENTNSGDCLAQRIVDENFPWLHNLAPDSIADTRNGDTHSSQDYVKAPKPDTHTTNAACIENDDTSNARHDSKIRHDTDSFKFTGMKSPTSQKGETTQNENFGVVVNTNLTLTQFCQTHKDTRQVPKNQIIHRHTRPLFCSLPFRFAVFFIFFFLTSTGLQKTCSNMKQLNELQLYLRKTTKEFQCFHVPAPQHLQGVPLSFLIKEGTESDDGTLLTLILGGWPGTALWTQKASGEETPRLSSSTIEAAQVFAYYFINSFKVWCLSKKSTYDHGL